MSNDPPTLALRSTLPNQSKIGLATMILPRGKALPFSVIINPKLFPKYNDKAALSSSMKTIGLKSLSCSETLCMNSQIERDWQGETKKNEAPLFLLH